MNHKVIIESFQKDPKTAKRELKEALEKKEISAAGFDYAKLWSECFGHDRWRDCRSGASGVEVMEAAGPVTTASFQAISGQFLFQQTQEAYTAPEYVVTRIIPERPSNVDFERVPSVTPLNDEQQIVGEGKPYPDVGLGQSWRNRPVGLKRGFKISLTRECLFFDKTGQVEMQARGGAEIQAINREKRAIDALIDENTGATSAVLGGHRYHYKDNSIASYGNSSGNHDWDNLQASNQLLDYTDVENAQILLASMVHPDTAEPIVFQARHLVVGLTLEMTAKRIKNSTEIEVAVPGYATSSNPVVTRFGSPLPNFEIVTTPYLDARLATDTHWFWGDITKLLEYVSFWAPEMKTLGSNTQLELDRDIVQQYRWSEYGAYSVKEPRAMIQNTVA